MLYPATILATGNAYFTRSELGLRLIGIAFVWDVAIGLWLMVLSIDKARKALLRAMLSLQDCTYTKIDFARSATAQQTELIQKESLLSFLGRHGLPYGHEADVQVFRVGMGESGCIPEGLGTFNVPFLGAVILVRDDPDDASQGERFSFWHEIGHTLGHEFAFQALTNKGVRSALITFVLALAFAHAPWGAIGFYAMGLLGLGWLSRVIANQRRSLKAASEMQADVFALRSLSEEERSFVGGNATRLITHDREMSAEEHRSRLDNVHRLTDPDRPEATSPTHDRAWAFFMDAFFVSANVIGWMVCWSRSFPPPTHRFLWAFSWLAGGTLLGGVAYYLLFCFARGILIELVLSGSFVFVDKKFERRNRRSSESR